MLDILEKEGGRADRREKNVWMQKRLASLSQSAGILRIGVYFRRRIYEIEDKSESRVLDLFFKCND